MTIPAAGKFLLAGALTILLLPAASQAAPFSGAAPAREAAAVNAVAERVALRCRLRDGKRVCVDVADRGSRAPGNQPFTYGSPKADSYPAGSAEWWKAMEHEGRTGITRN
jgi:hypothetical protein